MDDVAKENCSFFANGVQKTLEAGDEFFDFLIRSYTK